MNEYYFLQLTKREQGYYRKVIEAVVHGDAMVKAGFLMTTETITKVVTAVNYDHPEYFYVDFRHLNFITTPNGVILQINYIIKHSVRKSVEADLNNKIEAILGAIKNESLTTDYQKCRWIHNYLAKKVRYNYEALSNPDGFPDSFGIRGVFFDNLAVCEGISKAFKLLCDRLGVNAFIAFGTSSMSGFGNEIPHAWNMVCLDKLFYHIDVTWDMGMSETSQFIRYDYFCLPDPPMRIDHVYENYPNCIDDSLSYFQQRRRYFTSGQQLQKYLDAELKKNATVFYFKVENSNIAFEEFSKRISEQVYKAVSTHLNCSYYIEMIPNEKQKCFFFRIKKQ